jgi:acyl carrier protein
MKSFEEVVLWLRAQIAREIKSAPEMVPTTVPFTDFGLDSMIVVTLVGDLEDWLQTSLDPTIFWEFPSIEILSGWLVNEHLKESV